MPEVKDKTAVFRACSAAQGQDVIQAVDIGERHEFIQDAGIPVGRLPAQGGVFLDELVHGTGLIEEITHLDMSRRQYFGSIHEHLTRLVRLAPASGVIQEPVGEKFKFQVYDTVVIQYLLHFLERTRLQGVFQVGMPDAYSLEPDPGGGFHPVLEIEDAVFVVGMGVGPAGEGPVRTQYIHVSHYYPPTGIWKTETALTLARRP